MHRNYHNPVASLCRLSTATFSLSGFCRPMSKCKTTSHKCSYITLACTHTLVRRAGTGRLIIVSLRTADNLVPCLSSRRAAGGPAVENDGSSDAQAVEAAVSAGGRGSLALSGYDYSVLECLQCSSTDASQPTFYIYVLQPVSLISND